MFNKTILRLTTHTPPFILAPTVSQQCIVKSTALNQNPVQVINPSVFNPEQVVSVINKSSGQTYQYTYSVRAHVESYNFLRVTRGIANVMFSS
jgi:hypothetical protein